MKRWRVASATAWHCASPILAWSALHCARSSLRRSRFATRDSTDSIEDREGSDLPQPPSTTAEAAMRMKFFMAAPQFS